MFCNCTQFVSAWKAYILHIPYKGMYLVNLISKWNLAFNYTFQYMYLVLSISMSYLLHIFEKTLSLYWTCPPLNSQELMTPKVSLRVITAHLKISCILITNQNWLEKAKIRIIGPQSDRHSDMPHHSGFYSLSGKVFYHQISGRWSRSHEIL